MPFVVGTSLRQIKNAKDCAKHLAINNGVIEMFLSYDKIEMN